MGRLRPLTVHRQQRGHVMRVVAAVTARGARISGGRVDEGVGESRKRQAKVGGGEVREMRRLRAHDNGLGMAGNADEVIGERRDGSVLGMPVHLMAIVAAGAAGLWSGLISAIGDNRVAGNPRLGAAVAGDAGLGRLNLWRAGVFTVVAAAAGEAGNECCPQ